MRRLTIYSIVLLGAASLPLGYGSYAVNKKMEHQSHSELMNTSNSIQSLPKEPGQSAFAAIAEIVSLLSDDPATDWTKVDIPRLRNHLVDMELVTTEAQVERELSDTGIVYSINGTARTRLAIQTMVPAHANELNKSTDWNVETATTGTGATMKLSPKSDEDRMQVQALGFFGVMATGAHHQAHHFAMAKGEMHGH